MVVLCLGCRCCLPSVNTICGGIMIGLSPLQIKINTNVTATIGDRNVELWCSYIKDGGDYIYYIKMEARNETSEEYLQIATLYPPELLVCPLQTLRMNQMKLS